MQKCSSANFGSIMGVIGSSIGSAAAIYVLVAITGYLTFGSKVVGNIVSMCKCPI
jgi:amino acid permease